MADSKSIILGIDEVGRGPWAGPLVVGAVILKSEQQSSSPEFWQELTDSKQLSRARRLDLAPVITTAAVAAGLGWVSSAELDRYGLSASLKLATRRAVKQILRTKAYFSEIIIDGTVNFLKNTPLEQHVTTLPKADSLIREVSAASIIAKVARDNYMTELATRYPGYGFENHVGYGTAAHRQALLQLGLTPEHRQSFRPIKQLLNIPTTDSKTTATTSPHSSTAIGQLAEAAVARHLTSLGHQIIAKNFRTKASEIDLVSVKNQTIYFTEVKYSLHCDLTGTPLTRITSDKLRRMQQAANGFLTHHSAYRNFSPRLAVAAVSGEDFTVEEWFELTE